MTDDNMTLEHLQAMMGAYFQRVREIEALLNDIESHHKWQMLLRFSPTIEETVALVRQGAARAYEVQHRVAQGDLSQEDIELLPSLLEMGTHQLGKSRELCSAIHAVLEGGHEDLPATVVN